MWRHLCLASVAAAALVLGVAAERATAGDVTFDAGAPDVLVLRGSTYELTLSKRTGAVVELRDRATGTPIVTGSNGCQWSATASGSSFGGCAGVRYRWSPGTATLTLAYPAAVVTVEAHPAFLDLRLRLRNQGAYPVRTVRFPVDLQVPVEAVTAGYAPNYLPGIVFDRAFFRRNGSDIETYPSRAAFADYLALDLGRASLAMYSVNPEPAPMAPVALGFTHGLTRPACAGPLFCLRHAFATWVTPSGTWTSPTVRIRVGEPVERSILGYRTDNRIDAYPSLAAKAGGKLPALAAAPLLKMDPAKKLPRIAAWDAVLAALPSPLLLHPVGFQVDGFDHNDPDFLPPDPRLGTQADYDAFAARAQARGQLVMPYVNAGWWDAQSPSVRALGGLGLTLKRISVQDDAGAVVTEKFKDRLGYVVSPSVPLVRDRVARLVAEFRSADCLFFDQVGSRSWLYDFNPDARNPLGYDDAWLSIYRRYASRCLMAEDGWDRMAAVFTGFHGALPLIQRAFPEEVSRWGSRTWRPFPLALWLLHDKVLLYQHDLCECTFTSEPSILTWNLAFGFLLSTTWDEQARSLASPWLGIASAFQRALGPHYAGAALTSYRQVAPGVTETRFGSYSVLANWGRAPYATGGYRIAAGGFLARTDDGTLLAGQLADGYRIVERGRVTFSAEVPG